jgi:hypothetical protein
MILPECNKPSFSVQFQKVDGNTKCGKCAGTNAFNAVSVNGICLSCWLYRFGKSEVGFD